MSIIEQLLQQHGYQTTPAPQPDPLSCMLVQQQQLFGELQRQRQEQQTAVELFCAQLYCLQTQQQLLSQLVAKYAPQKLLIINPQTAVTDALLRNLALTMTTQVTQVDQNFSSLDQKQVTETQYDMVLCFNTECFWLSEQKAWELMAFLRQSLSVTNKNATALCFFRDAHRTRSAYYQAWPQFYRSARTATTKEQNWNHFLKRPALNDPRFSMQDLIQLQSDAYAPLYEQMPLLCPEHLQGLAQHLGLTSVKSLQSDYLEQNDHERSCKHLSTKSWLIHQQTLFPTTQQDQFCRAHALLMLRLQ
jgi:hypothetical protein